MTTPFARTVIDRLQDAYGAAADPERAAPMAAYMRGRFPFLGIPTPRRRMIARQVVAGLPLPGEADLSAVADACWELPEREYQYFGCDLLGRHAPRLSGGFIHQAERLITSRSWWDTVDVLAKRVVGPLVVRHRALADVTDRWIWDQNVWLVRAALLHQLGLREDTDADRLFRYCQARARHPDFFVLKAIGWALRDYAMTDPAAVRRFVMRNRARLAPLSAREALRIVA